MRTKQERTTQGRLEALSTSALMALFQVGHDNYGWTRKMLQECESVPGKVGKAGVDEAIASGFLQGTTRAWKIFTPARLPHQVFLGIIFAVLKERWPMCGCVCACNQCILPYDGDDIEEDDPTWVTSDKVIHVFDGICEPCVPKVKLWFSVQEDGLISKWDHKLPKDKGFIASEGYPVLIELWENQAQHLEHARRRTAKVTGYTGKGKLR